MLIGYARVSTDEQDTAAQVRELKAAGCDRVYREKASGGRHPRELNDLANEAWVDFLTEASCKDGIFSPCWALARSQPHRAADQTSFGSWRTTSAARI